MTDDEFWVLPSTKLYCGAMAKLGRIETLAERMHVAGNELWYAVSLDGKLFRAKAITE
jgi:hypothetical protein